MGSAFTFAPSEVESGEPRGAQCRGSSWASADMELQILTDLQFSFLLQLSLQWLQWI